MTLDALTVEHIASICAEPTFARGEAYFRSGKVSVRRRTGDRLQTEVVGRRTYQVVVQELSGTLAYQCTCEDQRRRGGVCKHIVATLLAWVKEPETFEEA